MKRVPEPTMPFAVAVSLERLAGDIRIARLKRGLTAEQMAQSLGVHRSTYGRLETGDAAVSIGLYAKAVYVLGLGAPFGDLADPRRDEEGQLLDLIRLPKRARARRDRPIGFRLPQISASPPRAAELALRIGVLGAMSGPAAPWGLASKYSAEATAEMSQRGRRGRDRRRTLSRPDHLVRRRHAAGPRRRGPPEFLTENQGVRYIIGPNVEQTITAATPVAERNRAMLFPYSFTRALYRPPHENAVLSQIANYQAAPRIYRYLMESEGVQTLSIVSPATPEGLGSAQIIQIAKGIGLRILSGSGVYRSGADNIERSLGPALETMPDVLALPNLAPSNSVRLIARAREMGFSGPITTEAAQDANILINSIGAQADRLVMLGGASPVDARNARMQDFMARYTRLAGRWNDEAGTKVHTLELILATLQMAGAGALDDIARFKAIIPHFSIENPMSTAARNSPTAAPAIFGTSGRSGFLWS